VFWQFGLSARWIQRIPPGWSWQANFVGINTLPDPTTGQFPGKDATAVYERTIRALQESAGEMSVEDTYLVRDLNTGQKTYEYIYRAAVDPRTGAYLQSAYRGEYLVFPRQVEKQTYALRTSYLKGIPLAYQDEDTIEGLRTYHFAYQGRGEYTESYAGTADFPGVPVAPGQEIKCADDQFIFQAWVEPVTGEILKVDESCFSGDYVFDVATGQALYPVGRWGGFTAGDDIIERADQIRQQRTRYLWATRYLPALLWGAGLLSLGVGIVKLRSLRS
jgi:hypothetical protein